MDFSSTKDIDGALVPQISRTYLHVLGALACVSCIDVNREPKVRTAMILTGCAAARIMAAVGLSAGGELELARGIRVLRSRRPRKGLGHHDRND